MEVSQKRLDELKVILDEQLGREATKEEVQDCANTLTGLAELCYKQFKTEQAWKRKLAENPNGFPLEDSGRGCCICRVGTSPENSWYDKHGIKCLNCQQALDKKVVPVNITKDWDRKTWFTSYDLQSIKCGECGGTIIGEKKYKKLGDGTRKLYTYYLCSKYTHRRCKQYPVSEDDLKVLLTDMMDGVNIDKFLLKTEYEYEVNRFHKFSNELGRKYEKDVKHHIDIRSQMKYMVQKGTSEEKKRLLNNLGAKVLLRDRCVLLK